MYAEGCPTKRLKDNTPEELWTGQTPSVKHLKFFGSLCYRHIPDEKRRKLDDKTEKLILIGYDDIGAYKMYNPTNRKVVIIRYVIVDEKSQWKWSSETNKQATMQLEDGVNDVVITHQPVVNQNQGTNHEEDNVDDLLITGHNVDNIEKFKGRLKSEFEMSDLGKLNYFLGLEFHYAPNGIVLHQRKYIADVLKRFYMENCNEVETLMEANLKLSKSEDEQAVDATLFKQVVGSLRFICNTRPDINYAVGLMSRLMSKPKTSHLIAAKKILRYLKGTHDYGLVFPTSNSETQIELEGFSDSDWCGDKDDR
ncbi:copia-type polyprotein, partial [Trifolium pratense]